MKKKLGIFIPATLGMLTAFGPFVTDFYLPVLPEMTEFFHTSPALASLSLTTGMIGLAAGQVFIGPLTDKYGRKNILVGSMLMFAIASVLCIISPNIYLFNLMRIFQGIAGAGGIVISKSMATDMFSGKDLAIVQTYKKNVKRGVKPTAPRRERNAFKPWSRMWKTCIKPKASPRT